MCTRWNCIVAKINVSTENVFALGKSQRKYELWCGACHSASNFQHLKQFILQYNPLQCSNFINVYHLHLFTAWTKQRNNIIGAKYQQQGLTFEMILWTKKGSAAFACSENVLFNKIHYIWYTDFNVCVTLSLDLCCMQAKRKRWYYFAMILTTSDVMKTYYITYILYLPVHEQAADIV